MAKDFVNNYAKCRIINAAVPSRSFFDCANIKLNNSDRMEHLQRLLTNFPNYRISTLELEQEDFDPAIMQAELHSLRPSCLEASRSTYLYACP